MKTYLLPEDARAALIEYLSGKPYREVAAGVQALLALKEFPRLSDMLTGEGSTTSSRPEIGVQAKE